MATARIHHLHSVLRQARCRDDWLGEASRTSTLDEFDGVDVVAGDAAVEDDEINLLNESVKYLVELVQGCGADRADVVLLNQKLLVEVDHLWQVIGNENQRFVVDGHCNASELYIQPRAGSSIGLENAL